MRMFLRRLNIQNFKGYKDRVIEFDNKTCIKGQNGSGKTTIADAVMWVLFNKDSSGASTFDIRPKDDSGNNIDFIEIKVETVWDIDGKEVTFVKTQKQKWVTKRGYEEQTFQGNENLYEINTIPKSEKEFKTYIELIIPEEVFRFVSNTNAFMAQKPADRRKTLFKLVSDMTDIDVVATDSKFQTLVGQLDQFTSEEILSRDKKALLEYRKKLEEIPSRIDEVSKTIVSMDYSAYEEALPKLREKLALVEDNISDASIYNQVNTLKAEVSKFKGMLQDIEYNVKSKIEIQHKEVQRKLFTTEQTIKDFNSSIVTSQNQMDKLRGLIESNEIYLKKLGENYTSEKTRVMPDNVNICPVCHQEYPVNMKNDMEAALNAEKEKKLSQINQEGKSVSDSIKSYKAQLAEHEKKIADFKAEIEQLNSMKQAQANELATLPLEANLSDNSEYDAVQESLINAELNLESIQNLLKDADTRKQAVIEEKKVIQAEIDTVNSVLSGKQTVASAKARVEELKAEQRKLSQDIANVEKEVYLLEEFNKVKVNLLSEKINSSFSIIKWKLFERQINGGYNPVCEPMINGKSYSSALNSGHKILAELDIIQALQRIYEVSVPVFLDNAERINDFNIPDMDCQLVTLSVTDDYELKVVSGGKE